MGELPVGEPVDPRPARPPERVPLQGTYVEVVPLAPGVHDAELFPLIGERKHDDLWTYMFDGPFADRAAFDAYIAKRAASEDPLCYAIVDRASARAVGMATLMRIDPPNRVIEVGGIVYSEALQRTRGATEAMYLLARYVFDDLGYRRYEWKCNALNAPSRRAALRLGFAFEGVFRQHMIMKGRNRDTAWYAMIDSEWPEIRREFERWLRPENFGPEGKQITVLGGEQRA